MQFVTADDCRIESSCKGTQNCGDRRHLRLPVFMFAFLLRWFLWNTLKPQNVIISVCLHKKFVLLFEAWVTAPKTGTHSAGRGSRKALLLVSLRKHREFRQIKCHFELEATSNLCLVWCKHTNMILWAWYALGILRLSRDLCRSNFWCCACRYGQRRK